MTQLDTLGGALGTWRARTAQHLGDPDEADALIAAADLAEHEAMRVRQNANRAATYLRSRPSRYAAATYDRLRPEQNPRGLIAGWRERGPRTLLVAGPARTGKTTAAYAIANDAHAAGEWVIARTAADLSAALKPDVDPAAYDHAVACDLLVIDDLGRERVTDWWLEQLQRIVDARCANERRLITTTNSAANAKASYDDLVARYGDPTVERFIDGGGLVLLDGPAVRDVVTEW